MSLTLTPANGHGGSSLGTPTSSNGYSAKADRTTNCSETR